MIEAKASALMVRFMNASPYATVMASISLVWVVAVWPVPCELAPGWGSVEETPLDDIGPVSVASMTRYLIPHPSF